MVGVSSDFWLCDFGSALLAFLKALKLYNNIPAAIITMITYSITLSYFDGLPYVQVSDDANIIGRTRSDTEIF